MPRPNGVSRLKSRSLFVSHSGNLHSVVLTNAWAFATPLARGPCSPPIDNFSKDSRLAQIDRQRRAERNSDFRSTMAALGGSPVRFHLAKSRNCGLLPISPKRTEGLYLLAGVGWIRTGGVTRDSRFARHIRSTKTPLSACRRVQSATLGQFLRRRLEGCHAPALDPRLHPIYVPLMPRVRPAPSHAS